jgi:hypothetical protein
MVSVNIAKDENSAADRRISFLSSQGFREITPSRKRQGRCSAVSKSLIA